MLEDQSVLRVPPHPPAPPHPSPDSLKREMLLVELIEHFIPSSHPAESAASQRQRAGRGEIKERVREREREGEREEEMKEKRDDRGQEGGERESGELKAMRTTHGVSDVRLSDITTTTTGFMDRSAMMFSNGFG